MPHVNRTDNIPVSLLRTHTGIIYPIELIWPFKTEPSLVKARVNIVTSNLILESIDIYRKHHQDLLLCVGHVCYSCLVEVDSFLWKTKAKGNGFKKKESFPSFKCTASGNQPNLCWRKGIVLINTLLSQAFWQHGICFNKATDDWITSSVQSSCLDS